jgi:hypothetical protein
MARGRFDLSVARDVRRLKGALSRAEEDVAVAEAIEKRVSHTGAGRAQG